MTTDDHRRPTAGPVDWPAVAAQLGPLYESSLDTYARLPHRLTRASPPDYAGAELGGFSTTVSALAALRGPAVPSPFFALIAPDLPRVVEQLGDTIDRERMLAAAYALFYCNALRCCGAPLPDDVDDVESLWLEQLAALVADLSEPERHTLAFAAIAAARTDLVAAFAELPERDEPFTPFQTFGFDVTGFAGYLGDAVDQGASFQDVEPAWLDFVHRFPYKLETRMLGWPALLFAARAVYATLGDLPDEEVALELHRLVTGA